MLKNFLKDNIESRDPAVRRAAIEKLENSESNQKRCLQLARTDEDPGVREAAVKRVADAAALLKMQLGRSGESQGDSPQPTPELSLAISERLVELVSSDTLLTRSQIDALILIPGSAGPMLVCCHCPDATLRTAALEKIRQQEDISRVVLDTRFHVTREQAAQKLDTVELMDSTAASIKSRDKVVARALQDRVDVIRQAEKKANEHQASIEQLIQGCTSLAGSVWSPQYVGRFTALVEKWDRLSPAPSDQQKSRFEESRAVCQSLVTEHQQQSNALVYCEEAVGQIESQVVALLTESLENLGSKAGQYRTDLTNARGSWRISHEAAAPSAVLVERYKLADSEASALLSDIDKSLEAAKQSDDASDLSSLRKKVTTIEKLMAGELAVKHSDSVVYSDIASLLKNLTSQVKQQHNEDQAKVKSLQKQLGVLSANIQDKRWSAAHSLHGRVQKKLDRLSDLPAHKALQDKLAVQTKKLEELGDWVDFAARPKLEALCVNLEQLPDKNLEPLELASAIKAIQQEWKEVGRSPCSNELWPRFKTAGDKAFEPCALYFSARKEERDSRAKNKAIICEQLNAYLDSVDWDAVDWKEVEKTLRVAKNKWRDNRVTDRKPDKALEQRFTDLVSRFNEKLNVQYDENVTAKEALIEKARALAEAEVSQHTVNQTRRLQSSWKQVGIMRRKQDQELWEQFNGFCRQIHKGLHEVQKKKSASEVAHVNTARDLIKQLRSLSRAAEPDEKKFTELQDQFNALPEFPERDKKFLFRDFNQVSEQFSRLRDSSSERHARSEFAELQRKADLCQQYERLLEGSVNADSEIQSLDSLWDDETAVLPKDWAKAINARRAAAVSHMKAGTTFDYAAAEKQRRMLCIRAEILLEKETPTEDKPLRMEYQLQNLQQGIGVAATSDLKTELQALVLDWTLSPPASAENRDRLELRFQSVTGSIDDAKKQVKS